MDYQRLQIRKLLSYLLLLVGSFLVSGVWAAGPTVMFKIPEGEFSQTVIEFYKQAQVEILYASLGSVKGLKTHAVHGELEASVALEKMLEGTGISFEFESERSVLLKRQSTGSAVVNNEGGRATVLKTPGEQSTQNSNGSTEITPAMQEVVVTGSYIRGLKDIVSPLVIVSEREKKRAPYATVQDVLRTLSFNFGGGPNEDFSNTTNFNRGSSINLRGLGAGATLVLINGHRQPVSGIEGDFVDVSTIPWSAVDRIEVLPDGASALYGSDAIAGVVNIIMRRDISGGETQARLGAGLGGADETLLSQLVGGDWNTGNWLLGYQYSKRTSLPGADRAYAASADKRPFGGSDQRSFLSNPGNIFNPMTLQPAFAIPGGQDGKSLSTNELLSGEINLQNQLEGRSLLPDLRTHNVFLTASRKIGERVELFAEGRFSDRRMAATERAFDQLLIVPASNPFFIDPFGGLPFALVGYNFSNEFGFAHSTSGTDTFNGALGLKANIGKDWHANLSGYRGKETMSWLGINQVDFFALNAALADPSPETAFNPFGSGSNTNPATLDAIRLTQREHTTSDIRTLSLVADGALPDLPSGTPKLAIGFDKRRESLSRNQIQNGNSIISAQYYRDVTASFAELALPVFPHLDVSLASRYESYSDFGSTFNPKIGLRWSPVKSLRFRSSWGSSFRAPTLVDVYDKSQDVAALIPVADLRSVNGQAMIALVRAGSNENLHEETATTWTAGIDFAPELISGFTLSSTYYTTKYKDRTWRPTSLLTLETLLADDQWSPLVTRNPSQAQVNVICSSPVFFGLSSDCITNPPSVILDIRVRNLSSTLLKGLDIELQQALHTHYGSFNLGVTGTYVFSFKQAVTQAAPSIDFAGTVANPPDLRLHGFVEWYQYGRNEPGLGVSLSMDYLDNSRDNENPPITGISSATTFDIQLNYRTAKSNRWLENIELTLNAVNVFNEDPPFVNRILGYDSANAKPYGRVVSFSIRKNW